MKKKIIIALIVLALAGGTAFWYFVLRDEKLNVGTKNIDSSQSARDVEEQSTPDGTWSIKQQDDVFAGYQIDELFGGASVKTSAVGKSQAVSGTFVVDGTTISDGIITVDTTEMKSDKPGRDNKMTNEGLETDAFPEATFKQSKSVTFSSAFTKNEEIEIEIPGTLTLHGQSQEVIFPLKATWDGKVIKISGELELTLSDYGIEAPDSSFVTVDEQGSLKVQLLFLLKEGSSKKSSSEDTTTSTTTPAVTQTTVSQTTTTVDPYGY